MVAKQPHATITNSNEPTSSKRHEWSHKKDEVYSACDHFISSFLHNEVKTLRNTN